MSLNTCVCGATARKCGSTLRKKSSSRGGYVAECPSCGYVSTVKSDVGRTCTQRVCTRSGKRTYLCTVK